MEHIFGLYLFSLAVVFLLAVFYRLRADKHWQKNEGKTAVIVASFNEDPEKLKQCWNSIPPQYHKVLIDDHSDIPVPYATHRNKVNLGKKESLFEAKKFISSDYEFIVVLDSDTVLDKNAICNAKGHFNWRTGAVVGLIDVFNSSTISALYLATFSLSRAIQSIFGQVAVCSGAFTIYRAKLFWLYLEESIKRKIRGGEDRYLSFLFLKYGWQTKYAYNAQAYTYTPYGTNLIKQQQRWQKSFWRGLFYSSEAYPRKWILFLTNIFSAVGRIFTLALLMIFLYTLILYFQEIMFGLLAYLFSLLHL